MNARLMYVEQKDGAHSGEAWIGLVASSRTGTTLYFNGRAYRRLGRGGTSANHLDVETGERFWISGVKRRGTNRHPFGAGAIKVDRRAVPPLLEVLQLAELDRSRFVLADAADTDVRRAELHEKQNERRGVEGAP